MLEPNLTLNYVAESESDDEYDSANEGIAELSIERYITGIQRAFLKGLQDADNIDLDNSDPARDINELAAACARDLIMNDTAIDSVQSAELNDAKRQILRSLQKSVILKAFVAASEIEIFEMYFPSLKRHYVRFHNGNSFITEKVLKKFSCLITAGKVSSSASKELGSVLGAILECAKITQPMVRVNASFESEMLKILVSTWKGETKDGLDFLINTAEAHERKFPNQNKLDSPRTALVPVTKNYDANGQQLIEQWCTKTFKSGKNADGLEISKRFNQEMTPNLTGHKRAKLPPTVLESQKLKFYAMIGKAGVQDDFYDVLEQESVHAVHANSASFETTGVVAQKWPSTHEQFATAVVKAMSLVEEGQTCPNCFQPGHKLSACKKIYQKASENAAAFYTAKFGEMTNSSIRRIPNYISSYAKRWNN